MDWFKSSLQAAQKQAQEAAEKARGFAQQASIQARAIAEQASEQAKVLAEQASEQAKVFAEQATEKAKQASERAKVLASSAAEEAQAKLQQLTAQTATVPSSSAVASDADPAELTKYGVTPGLLETISGMTYSTFSDYPVELLPTTNPMGLTPPIPPPGFRLSPWQERHALLVLTRGDQLQGLRFALCPKRMSEEMFWVIYFTLVKTLLPPEAFVKVAPEEAEVAGSLAKGPGTASSSAKSLRAAGGAAASTATMPVSTHSSTSRLAVTEEAAGASGAVTPSRAATVAAAPGAAGTGATPASSGEGVLVDLSSSNAGEEADDDDDDDDDEEDVEDDGAEGGEADLDALEDDPELAAYLEEALDVGEGGEAEGLSDLGSATDDLDDYINQLDAELGAEGEGGEGSGPGVEESPARPVKPAH